MTSLIIPRRVFDPKGNYKITDVRPSVRPSVRLSVRPESDLRDGWVDSNETLESDRIICLLDARLFGILKFSFLTPGGWVFCQILPILTCITILLGWILMKLWNLTVLYVFLMHVFSKFRNFHF